MDYDIKSSEEVCYPLGPTTLLVGAKRHGIKVVGITDPCGLSISKTLLVSINIYI